MALGGAAVVVSRDALGGRSLFLILIGSGGWRLRWASETVEVESSS